MQSHSETIAPCERALATHRLEPSSDIRHLLISWVSSCSHLYLASCLKHLLIVDVDIFPQAECMKTQFIP